MEGMIATAVASNVYSYDHADLVPASASFHNRIRYILASKDDDKTKIAGVGAVFGRLGQSVNTVLGGTNPAPFVWAELKANDMPGMQVSLLPEYTKTGTTGTGWADWDVSSTKPTVNYGILPHTIASFEAPSAPSAAEDIKDAG